MKRRLQALKYTESPIQTLKLHFYSLMYQSKYYNSIIYTLML